ncbi:MAG: LPS export ABC transporter periplasmic protein LptC [Nitrococcus sp.]|nr:LPS export ABC transporter periplasmic protein LptC [Nitrococcus sp.]
MASIRRQRLFPAVVFGLLAIVAWWLFDEQPSVQRHSEKQPQATYYFRDFHLHATRPDGRTDYAIHGKRMTYYQKADVSLIAQPVWTVYVPTGAPWQGRSDEARTAAGGSEVQLLGDVRLQRPATSVNPAITLKTQRLHLRPREDYAATDAHVTVYGRDFRIEAIGAQAWMRKQRVQLLAEVKGRYDVSSH